MIVRPATPEDAAAIAAIWAPIITDTAFTFTSTVKTPGDITAMIARRTAAGQPVLVAAQGEGPGQGGQVLGFASYAPFRPGPGYARCMEHTVILAAAARRQGLGRALMTALIRHATEAGHASLIGAISGANPAALGFHAALGFVTVGHLPQAGWKFGRFHDLILVQKNLLPPDRQIAAQQLD